MVHVLSLVLFVLSEIFFQEFCQRNVVIGYFAVLIAEEFLRGFNSAVRRALEEFCGFLEILGSSLTGVVHDANVEFGKRGLFDIRMIEAFVCFREIFIASDSFRIADAEIENSLRKILLGGFLIKVERIAEVLLFHCLIRFLDIFLRIGGVVYFFYNSLGDSSEEA